MDILRGLATLAAVCTAFAVLPSVAEGAPTPLGRACVAQNGVRFCAGSVATRVASFDGVPLDVDVTLPASGDGPFPTIVLMHGWGGDKTDFESKTDGGGEDHYDNVFFASKGWAVVTYSARGFGDSCGSASSRAAAGCAAGWIHLADQRYEAHDTQFLLGQLVDEGIAAPDQLAASGISYGGGQSLELAFLNNRTEGTDGKFVPWKSPKGTPLRLAAAWPRWPWSDLASSLAPNGRFVDFKDVGDADAVEPVGVPKTSYTSGLYALGNANGFYSVPGVDPDADLTTWFAETNQGDPETQAQRDIVTELHTHHSAAGIPVGAAGVAPVLIQSGWTDDLFPAPEGLRAYNRLRAKRQYAAIQLGDLGHARGQNKQATDDVMNADGFAFLQAMVRKTGTAPRSGAVTVMTQTCPKDAAPGGPFRSSSWPAAHPGSLDLNDGTEQTVASGGGDPQVAQKLDPIGGAGACVRVADTDASGTAVYKWPVTTAFTLVGLPTVSTSIVTTGDGGQLDSRLWDVAPDGQKTLVTRGAYRLLGGQTGKVQLQLWGNGYRFEAGHTVKLELLGQDSPYLRPSNGSFSVRVKGVMLGLPTRENPRQMTLGVNPTRVKAGKKVRFSITVTGSSCAVCLPHPLAGAKVRFGGRTYRTRASGHVVVRRVFRKRGTVRVRATLKGYPTRTASVRVVR